MGHGQHWDNTAAGTAAAIRDAGLQGKVNLVTTGGGEELDCKALEDGTFHAVVMTDVKGQSRDISALLKFLLQSGLEQYCVVYQRVFLPLQYAWFVFLLRKF